MGNLVQNKEREPMKFHRSVPLYIQQFAEDFLAFGQLTWPRGERFFALVGALGDERLDDFYKRLAESDRQQVKKLILLLVGLDPDFALERTDEGIKKQEELIVKVREVAQGFIDVGSQYLGHFPISSEQPFISEKIQWIDLPVHYVEEMETLRKAVIAAQECLSRFQAHSPYIDPLTKYVLDSRKKTPRTRRIRQLVQLFFEEKIELRTRSVPTVLSLGLQIMGDEDLEVSQVATIFREFSKLFAQQNVAE